MFVTLSDGVNQTWHRYVDAAAHASDVAFSFANLPVGAQVTITAKYYNDARKLEQRVSASAMLRSGQDDVLLLMEVLAPFNIKSIPIAGENVATEPCGESSAGPFVQAKFPVDVDTFEMAKTELTYAQWYDVCIWAESSGYMLADKEREGNKGTDGPCPRAADSP